MTAILQCAYGEPAQVLSLGEADKPVAAAGEVLVRVKAASVHADVWHVVRGWPDLLRAMGGRPGQAQEPYSWHRHGGCC